MKDSEICKTCAHYNENGDDDCALSDEHNLDYCQYKPKEEK